MDIVKRTRATPSAPSVEDHITIMSVPSRILEVGVTGVADTFVWSGWKGGIGAAGGDMSGGEEEEERSGSEACSVSPRTQMLTFRRWPRRDQSFT